MFKEVFLCLFLVLPVLDAGANYYKLSGRITDTTGLGLEGVSVSLLDPLDSTLVRFGVTNNYGNYIISDAKEGDYLLQIALMGYYTQYKFVAITPGCVCDEGTDTLAVNEKAHLLTEVIISGERVPVRIVGDTLEYNAGSFKVKPDAVVEDLLRKLPGIEVDKEGNIKSMGKSVDKILVDGKEFFGDDPKIASRNLPADAIDKIQAFEKRTEESLFSGIDDGQREQTLNLLLKDGKKAGYFGEVQGGLGMPDKYESALKAFKFRQRSQVAALGMVNNINKFGFTFEDYLNFNGGLSSLVKSGGRLELNPDEVPVDFGQPVSGKVTSAALGLNYMLEPWKDTRLTFNYMGNGAQKWLDQYIYSRNFTPGGDFEKEDQSYSASDNQAHRVSASWRTQVDSTHLLTINAYGAMGSNNNDGRLYSQSLENRLLQNELNNRIANKGFRMETGGVATWVKKGRSVWPVWQTTMSVTHTLRNDNSRWHNETSYPGIVPVSDEQHLDNRRVRTLAAISSLIARSLGKGYFLEPFIGGNMERETNRRIQGPLAQEEVIIDSLSPVFYRDVMRMHSGLTLKKNRKYMQWNMSLKAEKVMLITYLNGMQLGRANYIYGLPSAFFQKDLSKGKRLALRYNTEIYMPDVLQLLPTTDYSNPLLQTKGNPQLRPEYTHSLGGSYHLFDQFAMSFLNVSLNARYTRNRIDWNRTILPDFSQQLQMANTPYALQTQLGAQYSKPLNRWGIRVQVGINERWIRSVIGVNEVENRTNTLNHQLDLSLGNIGNDLWDVRCGGTIVWSDTRYAMNRELNNVYYNYTGFAHIGFRPSKNWNFVVSADVTHYTARSFDAPVTIPLLKAEIAYYVFSNQRGTITLRGFDLLDRNKAIQRTSQLNYLMEQRSNTIGRFFILSFAYKLNKSTKGTNTPGHIDIRQ